MRNFRPLRLTRPANYQCLDSRTFQRPRNGGLSLHQLPGHAWHAAHDNEIGLDQVDSQRLISTKDAWALEDIIQQNCDDIVQQDYSALFDIQEDIAMGTLKDQADPAFWQM